MSPMLVEERILWHRNHDAFFWAYVYSIYTEYIIYSVREKCYRRTAIIFPASWSLLLLLPARE